MLNFVFALILQPELHQTDDILVQRGILAQKARFRSKVDTEAVTDPHGNSCQHHPLQHVLHGMQVLPDAAACTRGARALSAHSQTNAAANSSGVK